MATENQTLGPSGANEGAALTDDCNDNFAKAGHGWGRPARSGNPEKNGGECPEIVDQGLAGRAGWVLETGAEG